MVLDVVGPGLAGDRVNDLVPSASVVDDSIR